MPNFIGRLVGFFYKNIFMHTLEQCYELGHISRTHGLDGGLKVSLDVDDPNAYADLESVYLLINGQLVPYLVEQLNIQPSGQSIAYLEGVETLEQAQALKGVKLYLPLTMLPELGQTQFYYHEIIGFDVEDVNLGKLGVVQSVYQLPAQDLIAMHYKGHEVLIPINEAIVLRLDRPARLLFVNLPEGLLDVYLQP